MDLTLREAIRALVAVLQEPIETPTQDDLIARQAYHQALYWLDRRLTALRPPVRPSSPCTCRSCQEDEAASGGAGAGAREES
jgi:hypothetical protein